MNFLKFILASPAGIEIYCLIIGIRRPIRVEISPFLLKKISILVISIFLIKGILLFFPKKDLPNL